MEGMTRGQKYLIYGFTVFVGVPLVNMVLHPAYRKKTYPQNRTAIVTGATGNLGVAITFQLAIKKCRVIMACRDMEKCQMIRREIVLKTGNKSILCRHLDLEDVDSINRFAKQMIDTEPHIDILINNAAVKHVKEKEITKYGVEKNYFVNFLGPFLLTFLLMDKLKEASLSTRDSRIINVIGNPKRNWNVDVDDINFDKRKYNPKIAYAQSKLALAYFTILLDKYHRNEQNLIYVYGTSPGTKSILRSLHDPLTMREYLEHIVNSYYMILPDRAINPVIRCALDPAVTKSSFRGRLYTYFNTHFFSGWGKASKDENKAKIVWNAASNLLLAPK